MFRYTQHPFPWRFTFTWEHTLSSHPIHTIPWKLHSNPIHTIPWKLHSNPIHPLKPSQWELWNPAKRPNSIQTINSFKPSFTWWWWWWGILPSHTSLLRSPPTPVIVSPPTTPSTPGTPPYVPSPPLIPDPNSPFPCNYWSNHPAIIWGLFGWWGTMGNAFGVTSIPGFGATMSLPQALSNTRTDGYGTLYREGTAALLNSMVTHRFPYTTAQVRQNFVAALHSNRAAASQGHLFKLANEGHLKPRL
ncbi:hypothetical protein Tsubulata_038082 [Turnera subulata]|uniref:Protodermal factor 1 n=1 Tax=Turnera subulata TaxID=218843 RepID=A0A9Q0JPV8_9ROSI|nr:hypothetical protein Tsubulata_038082 [Turnera subulata]